MTQTQTTAQATTQAATRPDDAALERARHLALGQLVARWARERPDAAALVFGDRTLSYAGFEARSNQVAHALTALGVHRGSTVAIAMANRTEFIEVMVGVLKLGACVVPINTRLVAAEVSHVLRNSEATGVVGDESGLAVVSRTTEAAELGFTLSVDDEAGSGYAAQVASQPATAPEVVVTCQEPAFVVYTSGTTGAPKGAVLSHQNLWLQTAAWVRRNHAQADEIWMSGVPLFHIAALNALLPMMYVGGTFVISPSTPFSAEQTIALLRESRVTMCAFVPTQWHALCESPAISELDTSVVRILFWGASQAPIPTLALMAETFPDSQIVNSYGQTEMSGSSFFLDGVDSVRKMGSVGLVNPEVETALVDPWGAPVAPGEVGEIVFRGPAVMLGYYRDPEATAEAFRGGWFHTGDLARQDDEGYTYIVDRVKDVIISGGENIYPAEVEAVIRDLDGISEVAVVGAAHPTWVESPVAVVVRESGADVSADAVLDHCRSRLAGFKRPREIVFVDELPRNAGGKILKRELRTTWSDVFTEAGPSSPPASPSEQARGAVR